MPPPIKTDGFGTWNQLGEVTPIHTSWLKFPYPADIYGESYRLIFQSNDWKNINSFAWIRQRFSVANAESASIESIVTQAQRVYPEPDALIIYLPLSLDFGYLNVASLLVEIEIKKYLRSRVTAQSVWSVSLEELRV